MDLVFCKVVVSKRLAVLIELLPVAEHNLAETVETPEVVGKISVDVRNLAGARLGAVAAGVHPQRQCSSKSICRR